MQPTARYASIVALAAILAGWGVLIDRAAPLVGAIVLLGWLLAVQVSFTRDLQQTRRTLVLDSVIDTTIPGVDQTTTWTIYGDTQTDQLPTGLDFGIRAPPPVGATTTATETTHIADLPQATELTWATSGAFTIPPPEVYTTDRSGLLTEQLRFGDPHQVRVRPRIPRQLHVGAGGTDRAAAYGEHRSETARGGTVPAELREYGPEEDASKIEWNATARLGEPYVREFEGETDRETIIIADQRRELAVGEPGETMADYVRHYAQLVAGKAIENDDPTSVVVIDDEGTRSIPPSAVSTRGYRAVEDLFAPFETPGNRSRPQNESVTAAEARHRARLLADDEHAFGERLRPFFSRSDRYIERVSDRPLFEAVRRYSANRSGRWTVLITDDADRVTLKESVQLAARSDGGVLVVLTPRAAFEPLTPEARARYVEFETFRRTLAAIDGVQALELTPAGRIDTLLGADAPEVSV